MKSKRNTRRGRAKRWMHGGCGVWYLRGHSWGVDVQKGSRGWECWAFAVTCLAFPSRAAAMKAAESVAKVAWVEMRRIDKLGLILP